MDDQIHDTYLCASEDFKQKGESKIALDAYYQAERQPNESPLDFCIRCGWEKYIYEMLVVDFLILNRDRHGANIEVLRDSKSKNYRLAPLFDHGLSFIFNCLSEEQVSNFDVMKDRPIQCFVGSHSAKDNLNLIPKDKLPVIQPLQETDRALLFQDLEEILPQLWQDKIWEIIWNRWNYYEDFCNKK